MKSYRPDGLSGEVWWCLKLKHQTADRISRPSQKHEERRVGSAKLNSSDDEVGHEHEFEIHEAVFFQVAGFFLHDTLLGLFEYKSERGYHISTARNQNHQETG